MAAAVNKNNSYSTLAGSLTNVATSMTVASGHGDRFPIVTAPDWAMVTLADAAGNIEIVKVTARASAADTMTIVRAQEGTTARAWNIGDIVELRPTAGTMATVDGTQTLTNKSMSGSANEFTNIPTSALVVVAAIKTFLDAATLLAARAALGLTAIGEALATAASAAAARTAIAAAATGAIAASGLTMSTARVLGRTTAGTGAPEELDAAALAAFVAASTTSAQGAVELATTAEVQAGTDAVRAVTPSAMQAGKMVNMAVQSTTTGSQKDFNSIPSWVKRITVQLEAVSTNGTGVIKVQIGDSDGLETSGYVSSTGGANTSNVLNVSNHTDCFSAKSSALCTAGDAVTGALVLTLMDAATNKWTAHGVFTTGIQGVVMVAGVKALSAALDRLSVLTTDTFDTGSVSVMYE